MKEGTTINQYKIISAIGKGGMGEVFLAQDTKLDRKVALKILPLEFAEDADRMSRFVREAKSASALNHPNIITIYEIGESEGTHFIATEFIEGKTLNDYVKANPLNYKSALEIAIQVASGLDEALLQNKKSAELFPDEVFFHTANGNIYEAQGKYPQAADEYLKSLSANKLIKPEDVQKTKDAYEKGGWDGFGKAYRDVQVAFLNDNLAKNKNGYVKAMDYAFAYAYGKDKDKAIEYLNKAFDERSHQILQINEDYTWNFVRDDPRFKELVRKVGIPE